LKGNVWTYNRSDCRVKCLDLNQKGQHTDGLHKLYLSAYFISFRSAPTKLGPIVKVC
jgi:hypothetical protein